MDLHHYHVLKYIVMRIQDITIAHRPILINVVKLIPEALVMWSVMLIRVAPL
jgi:hypothetical protein